MTRNSLIAMGSAALEGESQRRGRVPRAADATRDPALPAPPQTGTEASTRPAAELLVPEAYATSSLLDGLDEAQQVEELETAYRSADSAELGAFQLAKMRGSVRKGELLSLLLERSAHERRGMTVGAYAESLGIKRQYVYELITAAQDIRSLAPLIEDTQTPLVAAQAAVLAPIYKNDPEAAGVVLQAAKDSGKLSAASLQAAARDLGLLSALPAQQQPQQLPSSVTLARSSRRTLDEVYKALAPKAIERAIQQDPAAAMSQVVAIETEFERIRRRLDAAKKAAKKALPTTK
ncbi:hypothetical protein [Streptomyces salyersiae]|uniref:Uncharacterized protein n=1 Tax=Streptomyces salyersiae TaxID=3075530 RepID=A0ABU2RW36_9ACTN|nr:hypothetical protein [Streptomyces sp. DSM 41770]MDT0432906.1 hypothetical protein [Streptomyces sp. DSM 41770]